MNENNASHYHILIVDNPAHAALLPFLHDPERVKPLLHNKPLTGEHFACIAQAISPFEEIIETITEKISLPCHYTRLELPYQIPALRIDIMDGKIAHDILETLRDHHIQAMAFHTDDSTTSHVTESERGKNLPSPGHYLLHPSPLHFVPYS